MTCFQSAYVRELLKRVVGLGFQLIYLPLLTTIKPAGPHVPILCTPQSSLKSKKRVLVVVNDTAQDLGIWSWRVAVAINGGLEAGSCLSLLRDVKERAKTNGQEEHGVVFLNPGQMWYSWKKNKALTDDSWKFLPRSSLVHPRTEADQESNTVEGSRSPDQHVAFVFENLLSNKSWVREDAELYVLANYTGGLSLLRYLNVNCKSSRRAHVRPLLTVLRQVSMHAHHLAAVSLVCPFEDRSVVTNRDLLQFLQTRTRSIEFTNGPAGACVAAPYHRPTPNVQGYAEESPLWPKLASGPIQSHGYNPRAANQEVVMSNVYPMVLDWFEEVAAALELDGTYENPIFEIYDFVAGKEAEEAGDEVKSDADTEANDAAGFEEIDVGIKGVRITDQLEPANATGQNGEHALVNDTAPPASFDDGSKYRECINVGGTEIPVEFMRKAGLLDKE